MHCLIQYNASLWSYGTMALYKCIIIIINIIIIIKRVSRPFKNNTEVMKCKLVDMKSQSENDHVMFIRHENRQQCTIDITYGQTEKQ